MNGFELEQRGIHASGQTVGHWKETDQFIGSYFRVLFKEDESRPIVSDDVHRNLLAEPDDRYRGYYVLVFHPAVLDVRKDYHINICDQQGALNEKTYDAYHIKEMVQAREKTDDSCVSNELVFHNRVPLQPYLHRIIVLGDDDSSWKLRTSWLVDQITKSDKLTSSQKDWYIQRIKVAFVDMPYLTMLRGSPVVSNGSLIQQWNESKEYASILKDDASFVPRFCSCLYVGDNLEKASAVLKDIPEHVKGSKKLLERIAQKCGIASRDIESAVSDKSDPEHVQLRTMIHKKEIDAVQSQKAVPITARMWNSSIVLE